MPLDGTVNPTTEIILGAIDWLERYGWCQGRFANGFQRCLMGAILEAAPTLEVEAAAVSRVGAANVFQHGITRWNDAPGRTKEEVIEALRRAL